MKYSIFFRDSTHILLTRDFISMMKEVPLYHQMNGGIHMNQLVTGKFIALKRKQKNLTQEQLAEKLGVSNKTISKWETGLSVPDSSMLIILANELDTTVSELLGEPVAEPTTDDLKILSEKLEVINLQLAKRSITKVKTIRWILISLCTVIVVIFIALASTNSFYLNWNYNDPELAVAGTILHGFEFLFVRLAPIVFLTSVVGIVVTYKKR